MSDEAPDVEPDTTGSGLAAEKAKRLDKIAALRDAGTNPYPYRFDRTHTLDQVRAEFGDAGARDRDRAARDGGRSDDACAASRAS